MSRGDCRALAVLTSLAVLVGLTGCASGAADVPPAATARAPHPASAISNPAVKPGVVATGALTSQDGKTSGHIVVTARDDGDFDVTFSDFHTSTTGDLQLELSAVPFNSAVSCFADTGLKVNLNAVSPGTYLLAGGVDPIHGDPSFLHTALLTQPVIPVASGKCLNTVVGSASLAWTLPDMRPNLHVVDSGIRTGGTGVVTMVDGKPASYAVAPDDVMKAIAERFGITVDDILYLNPTRMGGTMALAGETLNLSKKLR